MFRRIALPILIAAALVASSRAEQGPGGGGQSIANLKTKAEASDFKSTSTYEDVVSFMKAVDAASNIVFYTAYGKTYEGRDMPLAVVGTGLSDPSPAAVKATGKPPRVTLRPEMSIVISPISMMLRVSPAARRINARSRASNSGKSNGLTT